MLRLTWGVGAERVHVNKFGWRVHVLIEQVKEKRLCMAANKDSVSFLITRPL